MTDTSTEEGREKRMDEFIEEYKKKKNVKAIVRLIGGSSNDLRDYLPADEGEAPQGAE